MIKAVFRLIFVSVVLALWATSTSAQTADRSSPPSKVALVIGNSAYQGVPTLSNPMNDARAIGETLRRLGYRTTTLIDGDRAQMMSAIRELSRLADGADAAVFFYAGHAVEIAGRNLLLSIAATAQRAADLEKEAITFDEISEQLEGRARTTLIILDSCRDNPLSQQVVAEATRRVTRSQGNSTRGLSRTVNTAGLASVASSSGTLIAFSTAPGRVALDGRGEHSPFTAALLRYLTEPGLEIRQIFGRVRATVRAATGGQQIPWDNSSLEGEFYFVPTANRAPPAEASRFLPEERRTDWAAALRGYTVVIEPRFSQYNTSSQSEGLIFYIELNGRDAKIARFFGPYSASTSLFSLSSGVVEYRNGELCLQTATSNSIIFCSPVVQNGNQLSFIISNLRRGSYVIQGKADGL